MIQKRRLLITLLCLWLPFQALAGALTHCEQLAHAAGETALSSLATHHGAPVDTAADTDCHSHPGERHAPSPDHQHEHQCVHCSGSCHGVQSLMTGTDVLAMAFVWPTQGTIGSVSVNNGFSKTSQRPPRKHS